jgi:hypothetical protein
VKSERDGVRQRETERDRKRERRKEGETFEGFDSF